MDNYLLMGHLLRCKVIPKDEVHPQLWVGANRKWRRVPRERIERVKQNKVCHLIFLPAVVGAKINIRNGQTTKRRRLRTGC